MLLFNRFWFKDLPSCAKSYRDFRETGPRSTKDPDGRHWFVAVVLLSHLSLIENDKLVKEINVINKFNHVYLRHEAPVSLERHLTTGKPADRAKLNFRCPICLSAISQASCLICARRRQLTFPFLAPSRAQPCPEGFSLKALGTRCLSRLSERATVSTGLF